MKLFTDAETLLVVSPLDLVLYVPPLPCVRLSVSSPPCTCVRGRVCVSCVDRGSVTTSVKRYLKIDQRNKLLTKNSVTHVTGEKR